MIVFLFSVGNKIMLMTASVFENLPELIRVSLYDKCMDQNFRGKEIREIFKAVNVSCGFDKNLSQITCEDIPALRSPGYEPAVTCEMHRYTIIKDTTYTILNPLLTLKNDELKLQWFSTVKFSYNENIEFLPISPHQIFPNIMYYYADGCRIREISKRNFENLVHLETVRLQKNQIHAVLSDTFKGLINLKELDLGKL